MTLKILCLSLLLWSSKISEVVCFGRFMKGRSLSDKDITFIHATVKTSKNLALSPLHSSSSSVG